METTETTTKKTHAAVPIFPRERAELRKMAGAEGKTVAQFLRDKLNAQFAAEGRQFRLAVPGDGQAETEGGEDGEA